MKQIQDLVVIKKKWQRQHLLDTQSRSSLVGLSNFERWCSSLLVCLSLPGSIPSYYPLCNTSIYNVNWLHLRMHKMCQNITIIIFYVTHSSNFEQMKWGTQIWDSYSHTRNQLSLLWKFRRCPLHSSSSRSLPRQHFSLL